MIKCEVEWLKAIKVEMKKYVIRKESRINHDGLLDVLSLDSRYERIRTSVFGIKKMKLVELGIVGSCDEAKAFEVPVIQNDLPSSFEEVGLRRSQRSSKLHVKLNEFVLDDKVKYGLSPREELGGVEAPGEPAKEDHGVIHDNNSSYLAQSANLNDLDFATLNIDGQSTEVEAPPPIIPIDNDDDFIND
ncbi:hypothetical protein Tco_0512281 [Tanacetum coccineum]